MLDAACGGMKSNDMSLLRGNFYQCLPAASPDGPFWGSPADGFWRAQPDCSLVFLYPCLPAGSVRLFGGLSLIVITSTRSN